MFIVLFKTKIPTLKGSHVRISNTFDPFSVGKWTFMIVL